MVARAIRGAVLGCGPFAANHLHGWAALVGGEIVAVRDRDQPKVEAIQFRHGSAAAFGAAATMSACEAPDLVDIVTTGESHFPVIRQEPFARDMLQAHVMM